ncbi:MAG: OPT family oligopeptide transporter, partial [Woeseiales bacterium]
AAIAGDNMQDLKAGYILGATPWKQQVMQGIGVVSSVLIMAPVLNLMLKAYSIGPKTEEFPQALAAPQATLMSSVAQGVFEGGLPWTMIFIGAAIGIAIIISDEVLKSKGSSFRMPVLAVAVGIYLPLELSVAILIGGVVAHLAAKVHAKRGADGETSMRNGMLVAAGLITGEALVGIFMAIPIVLTENPNVFSLSHLLSLGGGPGLLLMAAVCYWMYRVSSAKTD